uniref:Uncharacterized protein n=1 Tax=Setaria italica TaxID=4555 RepID=K3ZYH8_SETIT
MDFFVSSYNYTSCTASSTGSILCLNENKDNMSKEMKMLTRIADSNRSRSSLFGVVLAVQQQPSPARQPLAVMNAGCSSSSAAAVQPSLRP